MRLPFSICYRERKSVRSLKKLSPEDKGVLAYSFYIPEMECKNNKLNIGFDDYDMIELGVDFRIIPAKRLWKNWSVIMFINYCAGSCKKQSIWI